MKKNGALVWFLVGWNWNLKRCGIGFLEGELVKLGELDLMMSAESLQLLYNSKFRIWSLQVGFGFALLGLLIKVFV